jgi:hypothetical protein
MRDMVLEATLVIEIVRLAALSRVLVMILAVVDASVVSAVASLDISVQEAE